MTARGWALGLILLAAAAAAWWFVFASGPGGGVRTAGGDEESAAAAEDAGGATLAAGMGSGRKAAAEVARGGTFAVTVRRDSLPVSARVTVWRTREKPHGFPPDWLDEDDDGFPDPAAFPDAPEAAGRTRADGRARIGGDLKAGGYVLVAAADDGARGSVDARIPCDGAVVEAAIDVRGGVETLRGRVTKKDGSPFAGRVALAFDDEASAWPARRSATLDEDGRFAFAGLPKGRVRVAVLAPGKFHGTSTAITLPRAGELLLVVPDGGTELAGRVVSATDGKPVAGAAVTATTWERLAGFESVDVRAATDAEGRFSVSVPGGGPGEGAYLRIRATGFASWERWYDEAPPKDLVVRLSPPGRVHGRVTASEGGAPVSGVAVYAWRVGQPGTRGAMATTGADGRYDMPDAPAGETVVAAFGGGWTSPRLVAAAAGEGAWNPYAVDVPPSGTIEVNLVVEKAGSASGRVLASDGAPVAGAVVAAEFAVDDDEGESVGWLLRVAPAATADDGAFSIATLPPGGEVRLVARAAGFAPGVAGPFGVAAGTPITADIRLPAPRRLEATVVTADGKRPIAGARVLVTWHDSGGGRSGDRASTTNAEGIAVVDALPAGELFASAKGPGHKESQAIPISVEGSSGPVFATISLVASFGISGRVVKADGTGPKGMLLMLEDPTTGSGHGSSVPADGAFSFDDLAPGSYDLVLYESATWNEVARRTVRAGTADVEILATSDGGDEKEQKKTVVRVVGPDGAPVPLADVVELGGEWERAQNQATANDGKYEFSRWQHEGWVEARNARGADGLPLPFGPALVGPLPKDTAEILVRLPPERRIEGVVKDSAGHGVRGAKVTATVARRPQELENLNGVHGAARTDAEGRFKIGGLGDEEYSLSVAAPEEYAPAEAKTCRAGSTDVVFTLGVGISVSPRILDGFGRPVPRATIDLEGYAGQESDPSDYRSATADSQGVARFQGLPDGRRWALDADPPATRPDLRTLEIENWRPSDESITLPTAKTLSGVVRDARGTPIPGASVWGEREGRGRSSVSSRSDGTFLLGGLEDGDYVLRAAVRGADAGESAPTTVPAGTVGVVLVVDLGVDLTIAIADWPSNVADVWASLSAPGFRGRWTRVQTDGTASFRGVPADGAYAVFVHLDGEPPRLAWGKDLRPGGTPARLALGLGATVSGAITLPPGATDVYVHAEAEGFWASGTVGADGRYSVRALPPFRCRIEATAQVGDVSWSASADADPDTTVDLTLAPPKPSPSSD